MGAEISNLDLSQLDEFVKFNQKIYPKRRNIKEYFKWQFLDHPLLEDKNNPNVLICKKENEIVGQFLLNPIEFFIYGKAYRSNWGFDNYVLKECRGVYGAIMMLKVIRGEIPYFGTGTSKTAKDILLSHGGLKILGDIRIFIWFKNPLVPLIIRKNLKLGKKDIENKLKNKGDNEGGKNNRDNFPLFLSTSKYNFKRVDMLTEWEDYHWESTLEFSRSSEFLKWRFFNNYQKYWFYLEENQNNGSKPMYFVVGKVFWKGVNILMLVDYKLPFGDTKGWKSILKLSKILAKKNNCDAIVTMSSHCFFDKGLKKNLFFRVGKKDLIITNAKIDLPKEKIHDRNFVYATMADSDLEFPFWWS